MRNMDIKEKKEHVLELYGHRCALMPFHKATAVHEEPPRSLNPNWENEVETWYPICEECHHLLHHMNREDAQALLQQARETYFQDVTKAVLEWWQKLGVE